MTLFPSEKTSKIVLLAIGLALALGACASTPPTGPTVSAVAGSNVSDQKFARDDAACRARAYSATSRSAAAGQFGLQGQYNSIYSDCMLNRGYEISETVVHYAYGPGPYYYGAGPYYGLGPSVYGGRFYSDYPIDAFTH